ncbi:MAG TPA: DUF6166 domain-containing protein [Bryobacteraceae bacterium]|jgi:hypothetical protein|nr:DUF6166 domain-containing protein [Bryobacteraceae bacterium]
MADYKIRKSTEEWPCTRFCRLDLSDESVGEFLLWLCDHSRQQIDERTAAWKRGEVIEHDPVEAMWGFDAPRHRMAKLLWQFLNNGATDEDFRRKFTFRGFDCHETKDALSPVQQKMKWVMDGLFSRQEQDREVGQSDWGEQWWLPEEHAQFVRKQLRQTHVALVEQPSNFVEWIARSLCAQVRRAQAIAIPCHDPARVYIGARKGPYGDPFVWTQGKDGKNCPLGHGADAYLEMDGTGFSWGYPGHGPRHLAHCILADAFDGDLQTAAELGDAFFEQMTLGLPRKEDFRFSRSEVMRWLEDHGASAKWESRRERVGAQVSSYSEMIADQASRLLRIRKGGGLRSQRFDVVPTSFESALYLDLMKMLEHGDGNVLKCAGCSLPVPYDDSGRANRQRARAKKGQPIYHPACFEMYGRTRKKISWQKRAGDPDFRERERLRAREYRREFGNE